MPTDPWAGFEEVSGPSVDLRPMVAHTPHEHAGADPWADFEEVGGAEPEREVINFRGLRIGRQGRNVEVNPKPTDDEKAALYDQAATVAGAAATLGTAGIGGTVGKVLASPYTWGTLSGAKTLYETGDPIRAAEVGGAVVMGHRGIGKVLKVGGGLISKALAARLEHQVARAAVAEAPAAASAAAEAAPAAAKATEKEIEALLLRATDSTAPSKVRLAARAALKKAGWTPDAGRVATPIVEEAAPVVSAPVSVPPKATGNDYMLAAERAAFEADRARRLDAALAARVGEEAAPVARKVAPIPPGKSRMATVYTRPAGLPPQQSEAARRLRSSGSRELAEKQAEAAKAAGVDIGEAFGTSAPKAEAPAAGAAQRGTKKAAATIEGTSPVIDPEKPWREKYAVLGFPGSNHYGVYVRATGEPLGEFATRAEGEALAKNLFREAAPATSATETALETRLRASVLLKKNPKALAEEIGGRVLELKDVVGPDAGAIAQEIEEVYGLPSVHVKRMVEMVLREAAR